MNHYSVVTAFEPICMLYQYTIACHNGSTTYFRQTPHPEDYIPYDCFLVSFVTTEYALLNITS